RRSSTAGSTSTSPGATSSPGSRPPAEGPAACCAQGPGAHRPGPQMASMNPAGTNSLAWKMGELPITAGSVMSAPIVRAGLRADTLPLLQRTKPSPGGAATRVEGPAVGAGPGPAVGVAGRGVSPLRA